MTEKLVNKRPCAKYYTADSESPSVERSFAFGVGHGDGRQPEDLLERHEVEITPKKVLLG